MAHPWGQVRSRRQDVVEMGSAWAWALHDTKGSGLGSGPDPGFRQPGAC